MTRRFHRLRSFFAAALALGGLASSGLAYRLTTDASGIYIFTWEPGDVPIHIKMPASATPLADGSTYGSSILVAMQDWNNVLAMVRLVGQVELPSGGGGNLSMGNGLNEIIMMEEFDGLGFSPRALAVTFRDYDGNTWIETDIVFNGTYDWDSYRGNLQFDRPDVRRVALHELGHLLGLSHPDEATPPQSVAAVMNSAVSNRNTLQPDDIQGVRALYGNGQPPANDYFINAVAITLPGSNSVTLTGNNIAATKEPGEPNHARNPGRGSVWWKFTPAVDGHLTLSTLGSNFDTTLGVYTGSSVAALTRVGADDDVDRAEIRTSELTAFVQRNTTYFIAVDGWDGWFGQITLNASFTPGARLTMTEQPSGRTVTPGETVVLSALSSSSTAEYQWFFNRTLIPGGTGPKLTLNNFLLQWAGVYTAVASGGGARVISDPVIVGVTGTGRLAGIGREVGPDIRHVNGNTYDQFLIEGSYLAIMADPGQVARASFIDANHDIVQVEFSGAGTLFLSLETYAPEPDLPRNYNQDVKYMRAHAGVIVTDADETTNLTIFTVGRGTAGNQALFRDEVVYDGVADVAYVAILSRNGKFGGLRAANANFYNFGGIAGVYAPGVEFTGPVFVGDIGAQNDAIPVLVLGSASDVRITGGSLAQPDDRPLRVDGFSQLQFVNGSTSHDVLIPAQPNEARLERNGVDVTAQVVVNPAP